MQVQVFFTGFYAKGKKCTGPFQWDPGVTLTHVGSILGHKGWAHTLVV